MRFRQQMTQWRAVSGVEAEKLERELAREVSPGHPLHGASCRAVARRLDHDDVVFDVATVGLCVVHLTWARPTDPRWPMFHAVDALPDDDC